MYAREDRSRARIRRIRTARGAPLLACGPRPGHPDGDGAHDGELKEQQLQLQLVLVLVLVLVLMIVF